MSHANLKIDDKFPKFMVLTTNTAVLDSDIEFSGVLLDTVKTISILVKSELIDVPFVFTKSTESILIKKDDIHKSLNGQRIGIFFFVAKNEEGWLPIGPFLGEKYA